MISRRTFNQGLVAIALTGLSRHLVAAPSNTSMALGKDKGYGPLIADPQRILDLPQGFNYRIISSLGNLMTDGMQVPDRADGMGCIALDDERVALIRNHEIYMRRINPDPEIAKNPASDLVYDTDINKQPLGGGTSTIVYNTKTQSVEREFMSLLGTLRNCSGGITPWGSWLTCEEAVNTASEHNFKDHGYVFEVPATAKSMVKATPIIAMGRFNHEAACVDPRTGIVYMTEDRGDSLFYRFIPNKKGDLHAGGRLQAMVIKDKPQFDTRNWKSSAMSLHQDFAVSWIDLDNPQAPKDDLRVRGYAAGGAVFARGEGIYFGDNEMYFCCTNGGAKKVGQIMKYVPSLHEGTTKETALPGVLSLFVESPGIETFNYGDNVAVAPNGHLIVCEDQYTKNVNNLLRGVTPQGKVYELAKVRWQTEPAGACFSPDGQTMFVNLYSPTMTLAITGPWQQFKS